MTSDPDHKRRRPMRRFLKKLHSTTARRHFFAGTMSAVFLIGTIGITSGITYFVGHTGFLVKDDTATLPNATALAAGDTLDQVSGDQGADEGDQNAETPNPDQKPVITTYTVKSGDTLSTIADSFNVSVNTVRWANDLTTKSTIKVGQELVILPFSGIQYEVKKGDTLSGIVAKYHGDIKEIMDMNGLESEKDIQPGDKILIPGGQMPKVTVPAAKPTLKSQPVTDTKTNQKIQSYDTAKDSVSTSDNTASMLFINPIPGSILTQGRHDGNAVDFGAPIGTTVYAAASGTVTIAKMGRNGGYGNYIVITHAGGVQTLYGHLSKLEVSVGETVKQGQEIAKSGNSGKSTGPHLHFGVYGAENRFTHDKKGTHY